MRDCIQSATLFDRQRGSRPLIRLMAAIILPLVAGCSQVQFFYNTADFTIELYASRFLTLDTTQLAAWRPTVTATVARHRREELPQLAALFTRLADDARSGFTSANLAAALDAIETRYRQHALLAVDIMAPLLSRLNPTQISELEGQFVLQSRADATDNAAQSVAKRQRKRAERYETQIRWFVGELDATQRDLIRRLTASLPDTATEWYAFRDAKRRELVALLRLAANEAQLRTFLTEWLVEFRQLPPPLVQARPLLRQGVIDLLLALDQTFTPTQRGHLVARLTLLRDDFTALQERPATAMVGM
ncbi:DUF6279 family lipoprotein [Thiospirillum jenense]|uniref:Lipoprotein n=1 Tax=Thiospirillum jenense TaxID=1653858 RepID=A0A839HDM8_9GAMM|nr:DUF6279 family lipoprotein [Thiospirillum jenense]MBB1125119.1 hypothetical protein [Thiospirillum jenense]